MSEETNTGGEGGAVAAAAPTGVVSAAAADLAAADKGAAAPAGGADAGAGSDGAVSKAAADVAAVESGVYRPDGIPEHYLGKTNEETIDKISAIAAGLREKLGKGAADLPKDVSGYEVKMSDDFTEKFGSFGDDDVIINFSKEWALKTGVAPGDLNDFINGVMSTAAEAGVLDIPLSQEAFIKDLGGEEVGGNLTRNVASYLMNAKTNGAFGEGEAAEGLYNEALALANRSPDAVRVFEALRQSTGEKGFQVGPGTSADDGPMTREKLREMRASPKYDSQSSQFDRKYRDKVDGMYAEYQKART